MELLTIDNVLFSGMHNDLAFMLGDIVVVLVEHQSTLNPNMPLRMLIYYSDILKTLCDNETIYHRRIVPIPVPSFYVLYNGIEPCGEREVMRLSDLYVARRDTYQLELDVTLLNINHGVNDDVVRVCAELYGYAEFIETVRRFERDGGDAVANDLTTALTLAVKYCIENGNPLADYLRKNEAEVVKMLTNEFDIDAAKRVWFEDGLIEKALQMAKKMLQDGVNALTVSKYTDLDLDTIQQLANAQ